VIRPLGIFLTAVSVAGLTAEGAFAVPLGGLFSEGSSALAMGALLLLLASAARRSTENQT
jgi:hypothetical protein